MSNSLPFVAFGSDTDCDGTSYYACGVFARDIVAAEDVLREEFGGMTFDGIYSILPYADAVREDSRVAGIMDRTSDNREWIQGETGPGRWVTTGSRPFRYTSLGANWNPWAGPDGDDTIGIPALDTRYED